MTDRTRIIADPGSTHGGNLERSLEITKAAKDCGCDSLKWQLFNEYEAPGNICLPYEWFSKLYEYGSSIGLDVYASVWSKEAVHVLRDCKCQSIKLAYSQRDRNNLTTGFNTVYISGDIHTEWSFCEGHLIKLFCIPEYPAINLINFDGLFPHRFDGFSSHYLGVSQDIQAIDAGARYIEKHFQLNSHINCPDAKFALKPERMKELCEYAHRARG